MTERWNEGSEPPPPVSPTRHRVSPPSSLVQLLSLSLSSGACAACAACAEGLTVIGVEVQGLAKLCFRSQLSPQSPACEGLRKGCWTQGQLVINCCFIFTRLWCLECACHQPGPMAHTHSLVWSLRVCALDSGCSGSNPSSTTCRLSDFGQVIGAVMRIK